MTADRYPSVPERITWTTGFRVATDKDVLGFLSTFADFKTGKGARVSLKKLIARCRLPRRTVERALQRLEADGWILPKRWHRHATSWDINVAKLAETWMQAKVVHHPDLTATGGGQLTAMGGGQDPDLTAMGGGQEPDLTATGGGPIPCTFLSPVEQIPSTPARRAGTTPPQQLAFGPTETHSTPETATADVWAKVLEHIEAKVNRHTFYTWWRDSVLVEDCGPVIVVRVANERDRHELKAHWIQTHFDRTLAESLAEVRPGARVEFRFAVRLRKSG